MGGSYSFVINICELFFSAIMVGVVFYKKKLRTSAVRSTNFGSILIIASCVFGVIGTCNILLRSMWVSFFKGRWFVPM